MGRPTTAVQSAERDGQSDTGFCRLCFKLDPVRQALSALQSAGQSLGVSLLICLTDTITQGGRVKLTLKDAFLLHIWTGNAVKAEGVAVTA